MSADDIRLSRATVAVPYEDRAELIHKLEEAGYKEAAEDINSRRAIAESRKPQVLVTLEALMDERGYDNCGAGLHEFRSELHHDVNG